MENKDKELMKFRAKEELKLELIKVIANYKSKEEPDCELTKTDVINVLASLITRRTE